jgi:photoactive yellow protein
MQSSLSVIAFGKDDIDNSLSKLSGKQIDELAFGAVQLDGPGQDPALQRRRKRCITGRIASAVIGTELLPRRRPVHQHARASRACSTPASGRQPEHHVRVRVRLQHGPTKVKIHMKKAISDDSYWIFVKRL